MAHQIFQDACGRPPPIAEEQHAQHLQAQGGAGDMFSQVHARGNAHANVVPMAKRSDAPALHKVTEAVRNVAERRLQPLQLPVPPSATFDELRAISVLARPVRAGTLCAGGAGKHHRRKRPVDSASRDAPARRVETCWACALEAGASLEPVLERGSLSFLQFRPQLACPS